jgi:DNA-binding MarR family transcriptional regulator
VDAVLPAIRRRGEARLSAHAAIRRAQRPRAVAPPKRSRAAAKTQSSWQSPGTQGEQLGVFDFPTFTLGRLVGIIKRSLMPKYVSPFGITIPEWRVLAAVASASALSFNEICATLVMDRGQVSRTLSGLLARDIVEHCVTRRLARRRGHAMHQTKVALTAKGRAVHAGVLPIAQQHQMILLAALDAKERAAFQRALQKVLAAAEQFEAKAAAAPSDIHRRAIAKPVRIAQRSTSDSKPLRSRPAG